MPYIYKYDPIDFYDISNFVRVEIKPKRYERFTFIRKRDSNLYFFVVGKTRTDVENSRINRLLSKVVNESIYRH